MHNRQLRVQFYWDIIFFVLSRQNARLSLYAHRQCQIYVLINISQAKHVPLFVPKKLSLVQMCMSN